MSAPQFTPGPWEASQATSMEFMSAVHFILDNHEIGTVALVGQDGVIVGASRLEVQNANARLIAAAPELYEALSNLIENPLFQTAVGGNPNAVERMLEQARSALTKARGKQ